jgi:sigma-54 dependent transcriptional regulator, acetoin dehydrogenase operon transcriptional activator AcoR
MPAMNTNPDGKIPDIIRKSHERSRKYGIQQHNAKPLLLLSEDEIVLRLKEKKELIDLAMPIITELFDFLRDTGFIIILTDNEACILQIWGDKDIVSGAAQANIVSGAFMTENSIGTNAMSVALNHNMPVQITADEHFISAYHQYTCSAAPIHDPEGNIIGSLNLTGNCASVHPHTLGLVVETAKAIEHHLKNIDFQKQLFESNMYAFAMMNSLTYGVFAIDMNDDIHWVNDTACNTLNIRRLHLINQPITNFFKDWMKAKRSVLRDNKFTDEESSFHYPPVPDKFLFSAYPIKTKQNEILGYLLTFREFSRVIKLINKYSGSLARFTFSDIVSSNKSIRNLIKFGKTVANSPTTILITGESGTGKEVFAQAIHNASSRCDDGFVALNCGAISPSLIESELFGYDDGAFTGAKKGGNPGKFELAHRGTLFLDEIGEMPLDMQVRLLRTLQEGTITRIGSDKVIRVDVRIIAATNKDLEEEVNQGKFRLDLFYRLNVVPFRIPPLRERREDLLPLLKFFLKNKAQKLRMAVPEFDIEILNRVMVYHWPGNIRELENFAEKLVLLQGKLTPEMMDNEFRHILDAPKLSENNENMGQNKKFTPKSFAEHERDIIKKTLEHTSSNISYCAKILGVSRNTLYLKMQKYGIRS